MASQQRSKQGATDAKRRLIEAAEALFARGGFESVSLRQIAAKAGQRNHHAVQYHFGSREGLVQAIFDFRMQQMEPARGDMLVAAERDMKLGDPRTLIEIIYLPQLALVDRRGNHYYSSFLCQYLLRARSAAFGDFGGAMPPNLQRTLGLFRQCLDFLPEDVAQRRLITASFMFLNILSAHADARSRRQAGDAFAQALEDTLNQIVAATCLPLAAV